MEWTKGGRTEQELEAFVRDSAASLYRAAYFLVWDPSEAEDLVQETLLRVAVTWHKVRQPERRLAYARKIVVNLGLDGSVRRSRRRAELDATGEDHWDGQPDLAVKEVDDRAAVDSVWPCLSRQQRAVLFLRYWEGLSESEVAELLGCSAGTVKSTSWRAVGKMRRQLGTDNGGAPTPGARARKDSVTWA